METTINNGNSTALVKQNQQQQEVSPFIEANTIPMSFSEIATDHIIPVYTKDNEPLISHTEFIDCLQGIGHHYFEDHQITDPQIRVSHPVKGRVPEAKGKPADQLKEDERTLYYERMAFIFQISGITEEIMGDTLTLSIGGVKSYSSENFNRSKGSPEHFKVFIGFINKVCTNLCVWTDGFSGDLLAGSLRDLEDKAYELIEGFSYSTLSNRIVQFPELKLTEKQFAEFIGKCRLYRFLDSEKQEQIPELLITDSQMSAVARGYYRDQNYSGGRDSINLWNLYNLLTGANKSSYIDTYLDRGVNAYHLTNLLGDALKDEQKTFWYLGR